MLIDTKKIAIINKYKITHLMNKVFTLVIFPFDTNRIDFKATVNSNK